MKEAIYNNLLPFEHKSSILVYNQGIGDIISGILLTHKKYNSEYDKISGKFWKGTAQRTAKCIYDFLKQNTHYVIEPDSKQTLRSPSAILYLGSDKNNGLDCKSYSLFIAGILDSLKRAGYPINWCYRFASYKSYSKLPHHVFVVLNPGTSNEVFVDPVLQKFNLKKKYFHFLDKQPMALIAMAGIGRTRKTKEQKRARKEKIKAKIKKIGRVLVKFNPATASSRNAFLLLVKLNAFNLAKKLYTLAASNPDKLKSFWEKIGGSYKNLQKNILQGSKQKMPIDSVNGIGVLPAIAAAIAAATPIVLKAVALLKSAGIDVKDLEKKGGAIVRNIIEKKIDETVEKEEDQESGGASFNEQPNESEESGGASFDEQPNESEESGEMAGLPRWVRNKNSINRKFIQRHTDAMRRGNKLIKNPQIGNFA